MFYLLLTYIMVNFRSVISLDCVQFQSMLSNYSSADYVHRSSGWLLLDAAETLFNTAKHRLFNSKKGTLIVWNLLLIYLCINLQIVFYLDICPEPNPKWGGLTEILKEIGQNSKENGEIVLVLCQSARTCLQLKNVIFL